MPVTEWTLAQARSLPLTQLAQIGRFNLRLLAVEAGIISAPASAADFDFLAMSNEQQASCLLKKLNTANEYAPLLKEMAEVEVVDKYRRACGELAVVMGSFHRRK